MRVTYSLLCCLCLFCLTNPPLTTAHPHMFFMMRPHVIYDATGVNEIEVEWEMDELNSELLIGDCDTNKNFIIDDEEMPLVRKNYSDVFAKDNFCVTGYMGKSQEPVENLTATLKQAYIRSRKARFVISIDYPIPFTWKTQVLALAFSQHGAFTSFTYDVERSPRYTKRTDEETPVVQAEHRVKFPNYIFVKVGKSGAGTDGLIGIEEEDIDSLFADLQPTQSFLGNIKARFFSLQAKFNQKVSHTVLQAKKGMALKMVLLIFVFALGYGLIHSAGPGHGKTFVIGFFMQHNARWYHAILFATLIAAIHVSSAIILSGLFLTFLSSYSGIERLILQTQISFGVALFIIGLGVYLLLSQIFSPHHHGHEHPHDHDHDHTHSDPHTHHHNHSHPPVHEHPHLGHAHDETPADFQRSMVRMAVVAGIIPCPLSITIMLLAVTQNIYFIGLLTVGGIALGIITVLSTVGILIIKTKETLRQISDDHHGEGWAHTLHHAMDYLGAVLIILLGLGLGFLYMPTL